MDAFEQRIRERLLARTGQDLPLMHAALARGDRDEIRHLAHRLRGAAGALELDGLSLLGGRIERASSGDPSQLPDLIAQLGRELVRLAGAGEAAR